MTTFSDLPLDIHERIFELKHKLELKDVLKVLKSRKRKYEKQMVLMRDLVIDYRNNNNITREYLQKIYDKHKSILNNIKYKPFSHIGNLYAETNIETETYNVVPKHYKYYSRQPMLLRCINKPSLQDLCLQNNIPYTQKETKIEMIHKLLAL